jgi:SSS family solute:Na+ symporter
MQLSYIDIAFFIGFLILVWTVSFWASRKEETSEDYFLAGRDLKWWLIGMSLIASNISTEHFVGMAGRGFELGLAIASYEWMAAVTLVLVAIFLLPKFLKSGIYTIPEFLEYRYNGTARTIMAIFILVMYVLVALSSILYSGALAFASIFDLNLVFVIWLIGISVGIYTIYGGLKAVVVSDMIQGTTLVLGGLLITFLGFQKIGGVEKFFELSADKLHTVLPWDHPEMPWVAVFIGGLWIPNIFYWGLNQFITQRTLAAKSLAEGQKGVLFAAFLKLLIPFIIVFPGIMAYELYGNEIANGDAAYPHLIKNILPVGLRGLMFAALFGAVMSSVDSLLNSASTIFSMDIYRKYINTNVATGELVKVGRITTATLVIFGCLWAPFIGEFKNVFEYIQKFQGFISPGIVSVFIMGIAWKKVPAKAAVVALLLNIPVYGMLLWLLPDIAFLHHMMITFLALISIIAIITFIQPLEKPVVFPEVKDFDDTTATSVKVLGVILVLSVVALYVVFF